MLKDHRPLATTEQAVRVRTLAFDANYIYASTSVTT